MQTPKDKQRLKFGEFQFFIIKEMNLTGSGSLQSRSHRTPLLGISSGLSILFRSRGSYRSGDSPPCIQNIVFSTNAAVGSF